MDSDIEFASSEKIKVQVGYTYYLGEDGYIWSKPVLDTNLGIKDQKVGKTKIQAREGYTYFVDDKGNILRTRQANLPTGSAAATASGLAQNNNGNSKQPQSSNPPYSSNKKSTNEESKDPWSSDSSIKNESAYSDKDTQTRQPKSYYSSGADDNSYAEKSSLANKKPKSTDSPKAADTAATEKTASKPYDTKSNYAAKGDDSAGAGQSESAHPSETKENTYSVKDDDFVDNKYSGTSDSSKITDTTDLSAITDEKSSAQPTTTEDTHEHIVEQEVAQEKGERPMGMTIIIGTMLLEILIITFFIAPNGFAVLFGSVVPGILGFVVVLAWIVISGAICYGLSKGEKWSWWAALAYWALEGLDSLALIVNPDGFTKYDVTSLTATGVSSSAALLTAQQSVFVTGIMIAFVVAYIYYMTRTSTRQWFGF